MKIFALLSILLLSLSLGACKEPCPECPECPETLECPEGYDLVKDLLIWECVKHEPPPPVGDPKPEDYVHVDRAKKFLDLLDKGDLGLGHHIWTCVRNPNFAVANCWDCLDSLGYDLDYIRYVQDYSNMMHHEAYTWIDKLEEVNRRCPEDDPTDPWCYRTNIRKEPNSLGGSTWREEFLPWWKTWEENFVLCGNLTLRYEEAYPNAVCDGIGHFCNEVLAGNIQCPK